MGFENKNYHGGRFRSDQCGFTLVELMITVVLLGIVLSLGVPSFRQMIVDNRMTSQANLLVTSLNVARSEAINRSDSVTVTATSGPIGILDGPWPRPVVLLSGHRRRLKGVRHWWEPLEA